VVCRGHAEAPSPWGQEVTPSARTAKARIILGGGQGESREEDEDAAHESRRYPRGPAPSSPAGLGSWCPERRLPAERDAGEDEAGIVQARLADLDRHPGGLDLPASIDTFDLELSQDARALSEKQARCELHPPFAFLA
jgi:hypothetical protein